MLLHFLWRRRFGLLVTVLSAVLAALFLAAILPLLPERAVSPALEPLVEFIQSPSFDAYTTFVELALLLVGVALGAFHFRHQRAAAFIERFNTPDVMEARDKIDRWLAGYEASPIRCAAEESPSSLSPDERFRLAHLEARLLLELEREPALDKAVKSFANLFQELGEACENRTCSPSYTRRMFDHLVPHYWALLAFWVEDYRLRRSPTLYKRFENLARQLREAKKDTKALSEIAARIPEVSKIRRELLARSAEGHRVYLFAYGSLIYSKSRNHVSPIANVLEARLEGYARAWNVVEQVRTSANGDESIVTAVFLDLVLSRSAGCNGVVMEVDGPQLEIFDRRESNYVRVDVTPWLECETRLPPGALVHAYIGRPESTVARAQDPKLYLPLDYMRLLEAGLEEYSPGFRKAFWTQTQPPPANLMELHGPYRFVDPAQNRTTGRDRLAGPD